MNIKIIRKEDEFLLLQSEWEQLHSESKARELCNSWVWLYCWWKVFKRSEWQLQICCLYDDIRLVAIAPYYIDRGVSGGCLRLMGKGEPENQEVCSEFVDILVKPTDEKQTVDALADHHRLYFKDIARFELLQILEHSVVKGLWRKVGFYLRQKQRGYRYQLPLQKQLRTTLKALPSGNLSKKSVRLLNQLQNQRFNVDVVDSSDSFQSAWKAMQSLHRKRWHEKGRSGAFESSEFFNFHQWVFEQLAPRGQAKILLLEDDTPIAAIYCFYLYERIYYYQSGIDSNKPGSPGILAHLAVLNEADGLFKSYDFMLGGTQSYKASWASELTAVKDITCYSATLQGMRHRIKDGAKELIRSNRLVRMVRQH